MSSTTLPRNHQHKDSYSSQLSTSGQTPETEGGREGGREGALSHTLGLSCISLPSLVGWLLLLIAYIIVRFTRTHARMHMRIHAHTHTYNIINFVFMECFFFPLITNLNSK